MGGDAKPKRFEVTVRYVARTTIEVEAVDEDEAERKAEDCDGPDDWEIDEVEVKELEVVAA